LKGELRVELFNESSDALEVAEQVWLTKDAATEPTGQGRGVEWARAVPKAYLLKLEGIDERNGADAVRGLHVWVSRSDLPPAEEGEYYLVDLIGARVVGPEGEVGTVVEIAQHPSVDSVVIKTADGRTLEQPLLEQWVARVSATDKLIELSSLEGLFG
jgi:16S rRNA processing protein RimM